MASSLPDRFRSRARARADAAAIRRVRRLVAASGAGTDPALRDLAVEAFVSLYDRDLEERRPDPAVQKAIVDQFHRLYYHDHGTWRQTRWRGVTIWKCPLDLWLYAEMVEEVRPSLVVETGTAYGGSALYLANLFDIHDHGRVVSIDLDPKPDPPQHPRVTYLRGSSTDPAIVAQVRELVPAGEPVLVILDSDHSRDHVLDELHTYAPLVTEGSYVVVEDTNVNGHPAYPDFGPGPMEAVQAFLTEPVGGGFVVDTSKHKFHMTFNPNGYLRRVAR